jgi:hypothetical protein
VSRPILVQISEIKLREAKEVTKQRTLGSLRTLEFSKTVLGVELNQVV